MSLLRRTQDLLTRHISAGVTLAQIARESGGKVDYEWLAKFAAQSAAKKDFDPGVIRVQSLHDHLARRKKRRAL